MYREHIYSATGNDARRNLTIPGSFPDAKTNVRYLLLHAYYTLYRVVDPEHQKW
jgi:hypothetical protein